ncbi:hypothetical protein niasHT_040003 [Heterodera trifolii]|uniref:B30.2/SPRY domain-containing protein n=1 Tax=Heterodera trifolii TaxID=157864 RepID=A0ABD2J3J2_9BILA
MATFSVALLTILIGIGLCVSSVRADEQQNKTENGGGLKHLFGFDGIRENQNDVAEKMSGIEAKLEQIENVFTELRDSQNLLSIKMENEIRDNQKALSLVKNMATLAFFHSHSLPIYRWNASDCHPKIVINESTNAIQSNATGTEDFFFGDITGLPYSRSCRAAPIQIMPSAAASRIGIIYTEYRILARGIYGLKIGLSTKEMPLDDWVGFGRVSYGYADYGKIYSNTNKNYGTILDNVPPFLDTGDVVGCGLNWATRQVFFTKNGQRLNITNLYVDEDTEELYPTVTLQHHGDTVEANFGPNFKYDLSKKF